MKIHHHIPNSPLKRPVVTIGTFDGLHRGHRNLLSKLKNYARKIHGESVVMTFWPHPRWVVDTPNRPLQLLNTLEEKEEILEAKGIDHLIILHFDNQLAQLTPNQFIQEFLIPLNIHHLIVGPDHQFGKNRDGSLTLLNEKAQTYNFSIEQHTLTTSQNIKISSTKIRELLNRGLIRYANELLGYPYTIRGKVVEGDKIGHQLGFPTANIALQESYKLIPKNGVYAVRVKIRQDIFNGMINIGNRPTITHSSNHEQPSIEVHIFNFNQPLYHQIIQIYFFGWIRNEVTFSNTEQLKHQLKKDMNKAYKILESNHFSDQ